ncbi:hypothetical protein [Clostridioides difficile]
MKEFFMLEKKKSYDTYANFKNKVILPAVKLAKTLNKKLSM